MEDSKRISFHFHPYNQDKHYHAIEKSEDGTMRRYLVGISSGIKQDLHAEKMTEKCIKSFQDQANSGDILLYEGKHGVNFVDDIGKLSTSTITPEGDWLTEYRLYDSSDGFSESSMTLEKADKLWRQVNGISPYKKAKQLGFSIEGDIPDGGILQMDMSGKRVMNDVTLDGVVVVPRPAYKDSIATAVYKALGEILPEVSIKIHKSFKERLFGKVEQDKERQTYYDKKYCMDNELDIATKEILAVGNSISREKLVILFQEYSDLMVDLILQHGEYLVQDTSVMNSRGVYQEDNGLKVLKDLESSIKSLILKRGEQGGSR